MAKTVSPVQKPTVEQLLAKCEAIQLKATEARNTAADLMRAARQIYAISQGLMDVRSAATAGGTSGEKPSARLN
jgi:hypothetical protein